MNYSHTKHTRLVAARLRAVLALALLSCGGGTPTTAASRPAQHGLEPARHPVVAGACICGASPAACSAFTAHCGAWR